MRTLMILSLVASMFHATISRATDDIERIPQIGFKRVAVITTGETCSRVADALIAREHVQIDEGETTEAYLIVAPGTPDLFPKHLHSTDDLDKLRRNLPACSSGEDLQNERVVAYVRQRDATLLRVLSHSLGQCYVFPGSFSCGGPIYAPGYVRVEFAKGWIKAGLEQIHNSFGLEPAMMRRSELSEDLERLFQQDPDNRLLPPDMMVQYDFQVEPRQEEPWALILNRLPFVESAFRVPALSASIDTSRSFVTQAEAVNKLPRSPLASTLILQPNSRDRSLAFLRDWFASRGGTLTVIKQDDHRILVRIDQLKGEVIQRERFWEYLKLNLILLEGIGSTTLYLMNDGYYAAGLGSRVPPDTDFKPIEQDYHGELTEYTDALATRIQQRLKGEL